MSAHPRSQAARMSRRRKSVAPTSRACIATDGIGPDLAAGGVHDFEAQIAAQPSAAIVSLNKSPVSYPG
jgi:hypothetical protein